MEISISFIEVYNENLRDLLNPNPRKDPDLREHPTNGATLANVMEIKVDDTKEILSLLRKGNERRITESTGANATSSRSHAVL